MRIHMDRVLTVFGGEAITHTDDSGHRRPMTVRDVMVAMLSAMPSAGKEANEETWALGERILKAGEYLECITASEAHVLVGAVKTNPSRFSVVIVTQLWRALDSAVDDVVKETQQ